MNKPNRFLCLLLLTSIPIWAETQPTFSDYPISAVDIKNVEINDAFWLPKIKIIQDTTIQYAFKKCEEEGRMENFLIAGGRKKGPVRGKMPFDDTDVYKIIEGASYSLISRPNPALAAYLDSIISIIKIGQEPDGYLTTWFTIDRMHPPAWWAQPSPNRWDHEESNHELYNSGHLFEAAAAHYRATGKQNFLKIALKNADLLVASFGPDKLRVPPGHQIVETGLIKLYHITNNPQYVELARFFLELRGDSTSHKLYGEYSQDHLPVTKQTEAVGHAVRAMYMYAGMTDIAAIYQDSAYFEALMKIWENIVTKKMYLTGGVGARHDGEAFGDNYELPNLTAYNETCAAIGSVYWNQRLFRLTGDAQYYDIIERTLYNGLISGISLDGKKFFYPNPLESDGKYQFNQGACTRQPWFDCSCCPTNIIRFLPSVPELIYATIADSVYINLYISSNADIIVNQKKIEIIQQTDYP
nr:glycoside hydrolase family 127 protein [Candidatus Neomarinimicrobiota bacterium]